MSSQNGSTNTMQAERGADIDLPNFEIVTHRDGRKTTVANASELMQRLRLASRYGLQYGGERDIPKMAGYLTNPSFDDYWGLYERDPIAGRIIDMPAETMWRKPPRIWETDKVGEETEFTKAFDALAKRLRLWAKFEHADRISGVGRFGVLLIGARGGDDGALKSELEVMQGQEDVLYLQAYHEGAVRRIQKWVTDPTDERFMLPELYEIRMASGANDVGVGTTTHSVHWSRVVHIADDFESGEVYGRPRLKRVLNRLFDLEKVAASTGEGFWQLAARVLAAQVDPTKVKVDDPALDDLEEQMAEIVHDLRRQWIGQGAELSWLSGEAPEPQEAGDFFFSVIAAGSGIPKRILFGSETGERASEQDERQWLGGIVDRQESFGEPVILRPTIDRLIQKKALPEPKKGYVCVWPNRRQLDEKDRAELNLMRAKTAKEITPIGGDPREMITIAEDNRIDLVPTGEAQ